METRNEYNAIVKINSVFGEVNYFLVVRNKKTINEGDILFANKKANENKMPCYFLHCGKLTKRAIDVTEQYKNLIKIDIF